MEFKKGNLIFLKSTLVDLIYIVKCQTGEVVTARKIDAPPETFEKLQLDRVVLLAEEQEKILPRDLVEAIFKQRQIIYSQPKKGGKKKEISVEKMLSKLPKESLDEILQALAQAGIKEEEEEEEDDSDKGDSI